MDFGDLIWILPSAVALFAVIWFFNGIRLIGRVSSGKPIGKRSKKALVLIDLQSAFWEAGTFSETDKAAAKKHILHEVQSAKEEGIPVIAVRHEWSIPSTKAIARVFGKGLAIAGKPGTELLEPLDELADHVLVKRVQDAFETDELDELLAKLDVGVVRILGLDTNFCVAKTATAARQREYDVEIALNGVLSANHKKAEQTLLQLQEQNVTLI
ncbi:cysteine hydrolase family protein [Epibacterium sp. Ofav1-8]|uniref:cysteine hydrolase family protein n=1 Tax=Epibacterium sp. Ofav1-8 TaxID=2917735 RepID=UPI001EF5A663|nr:cysteine hydrolase [Epibacterium sp. Ofav1-8]MCG7626087.1 cysteine hydrolase [Epibacterium sp. Ofav1-8]